MIENNEKHTLKLELREATTYLYDAVNSFKKFGLEKEALKAEMLMKMIESEFKDYLGEAE